MDMQTHAGMRWAGTAHLALPCLGATTVRRHEGGCVAAHAASRRRSIVLATLRSTPFDAQSAELAVDLALETAAPLVVVNVVDMPVGRCPGRDLGDPPAVAASLGAPADRAAALGVAVTVLRVRSVRPVATLVDLVRELAPGAVVFGPDPARLSRLRHLSPRQYRRAARMLAARTTCLLWRPELGQRDAPTAPPSARRPIASTKGSS
jgi:nucleotide-binding universal stress UspA family protein